MTSPDVAAQRPKRARSHRSKPECRREGCNRQAKRSDRLHCHPICELIELEQDRLQEIYETAGDPALSRDAWLNLVEVADVWSEYLRERGRLVRSIYKAELPMPPKKQDNGSGLTIYTPSV